MKPRRFRFAALLLAIPLAVSAQTESGESVNMDTNNSQHEACTLARAQAHKDARRKIESMARANVLFVDASVSRISTCSCAQSGSERDIRRGWKCSVSWSAQVVPKAKGSGSLVEILSGTVAGYGADRGEACQSAGNVLNRDLMQHPYGGIGGYASRFGLNKATCECGTSNSPTQSQVCYLDWRLEARPSQSTGTTF